MLQKTRIVVLIIGVAASIAIFLLPLPEGLTLPGKNCLAIFVLCVSLWFTNVIPFGITGLLAIGLLALIVFEEPTTAFKLFGNRAVFFILGVFILSASMIKTGLSKRITLIFLRRFEKSPKTLLFGIFFTTAFLSLWMPEHAVAAMAFPIVLEIARELKLIPKESRYGKALFVTMAWGCVIGGIGTLLGGARAPLAIGMLKENYGISISFSEWMIAALPAASLIFIAGFFIILKIFPSEIDNVRSARLAIEEELSELHRLSLAEKKVGIVMLITIICWIFLGKKVDLAVISILGAISIFIIRAVKWGDIKEYVNWAILLMYGGAVALGYGLNHTKATEWVVNSIFHTHSISPLVFTAVTVVIMIILTETISNVAAVAAVLPVAFQLAEKIGIAPENIAIIAYIVALPAGLAFALPIGTPPNAIAYSSGYYNISDTIKAGILISPIAIIILFLMIKFYWPLLGIRF